MRPQHGAVRYGVLPGTGVAGMISDTSRRAGAVRVSPIPGGREALGWGGAYETVHVNTLVPKMRPRRVPALSGGVFN